MGVWVDRTLFLRDTYAKVINSGNNYDYLMKKVTSLDYDWKNRQLTLWIATDKREYELNGFESLFLDYVNKVLDSDFEDSTLFFRDQPYQKLIMSKKSEDLLELGLNYPDSDRGEEKMEVERERFKEFLERIRDSLEK